MPKPEAKLIYSSSEQSADMLYATGMFVPDPFIWCQIDGQDIVIVSPLEIGRFRKQLGDQTLIFGFADAKKRFKLRSNKPEAQIAGLSREYGVKTWTVPDDFPLGLSSRLKRYGISCKPTKGGFFPDRQWKSEQEIQRVTEGVQLAELGLEAGLTMLKDAQIVDGFVSLNGTILTAEVLRGEIDSTICRAGGIATHTIVAPGTEGADPHNSGHGPIRANEPIIIDIFPRVTSTGYFGDLTRTVVKGKAPELVTKAYEAVRQARDTAKERIRPGVNGQDVHNEVAQILTDSGFETDLTSNPPCGFFHGTGHGLGLEIHESPRISKSDCTLEVGHVVTVEPGLYYADWGGVRLEDVVVVTTDGCRTLTTVPTYLEIL